MGERARRAGHYRGSLLECLIADYEAALADPQRHSLAHEIALTEAHLHDLLRRRYACGDPGKGWGTLTAHWRQLQAALVQGDNVTMRQLYDAMGPLLERLPAASMLDAKIREQIRLVAHLRIQEHKRLIDLQTEVLQSLLLHVE